MKQSLFQPGEVNSHYKTNPWIDFQRVLCKIKPYLINTYPQKLWIMSLLDEESEYQAEKSSRT